MDKKKINEIKWELVKFIVLITLLIIGVSYIIWLNSSANFPEL